MIWLLPHLWWNFLNHHTFCNQLRGSMWLELELIGMRYYSLISLSSSSINISLLAHSLLSPLLSAIDFRLFLPALSELSTVITLYLFMTSLKKWTQKDEDRTITGLQAGTTIPSTILYYWHYKALSFTGTFHGVFHVRGEV